MRASSVVLLVVACALFAVPATAGGKSSTHTYLLVMEEPNVSQAPNGDRVAITGEGAFQVHPKAVDAEGGSRTPTPPEQ